MSILKQVQLYGQVIIKGYLRAKTGLHIGKGRESITVGGLDNAVMRDPVTGYPYIPGSSLKGKLRALAEKSTLGAVQNQSVGRGVYMHVCDNPTCPVCRIFGAPAEKAGDAPTRLVVRDIQLEKDSVNALKASEAGANLTEVKYEASIDRVTATANPRPFERVPAGALFGPFEMIFSLYKDYDYENIRRLLQYMELLEMDYLGGAGSRGSGQVAFESLSVEICPVGKLQGASTIQGDLAALRTGADALVAEIKTNIAIQAG